MDKESVWLQEWTRLIDGVHSALEEQIGCLIDRDELKTMAVERLGAESAIMLMGQDLPDVDELTDLVREDARIGRFSAPLQEIQLDESLIPPGIFARLDEETVKSGGEIWRIFKYDADPFPSNPHAHNLETGLKLHLGTGELFEKTTSKGRLRCKSLKKLRSLVHSDIQLPEYTCS